MTCRLLLFCLLSCLSLRGQAQSSLDSLFRTAKQLEERIDYRNAYRTYRQCFERDTLNKEILLALARTATNLGYSSEAESYFNRVLAQDSTDFYANYQLGRLHYQLGEYDNAIQYYSRLMDDSIPNPTLLRQMGDCFMRKDDLVSAVFAYFSAYQVNRENAGLAIQLANSMMMLADDQIPDAISICDTALRYNPNNRQLLKIKAQGLYKTRQYARADTLYSGLLAQGDSTFNVLKYGGASKYYAGLLMPSIPLLEGAYQQDTTDIEVSLLLGSALGKTYDRQRAYQLFAHVEELMRPRPEINNLLRLFRAETLARDNRQTEAIRLYYALWKEHPGRLSLLHSMWELCPYDHIDKLENGTMRERVLFIHILYVRELLSLEEPPKQLDHFLRLLESLQSDLFFRGQTSQPLLAPDGAKSSISSEEIHHLIALLKHR